MSFLYRKVHRHHPICQFSLSKQPSLVHLTLFPCRIKKLPLPWVGRFGFDPPFQKMIHSYQQTGDQRVLWPCHMLGRRKEYCQIERPANLSFLPISEKLLLSCFPIRLKECGAGPSRVVALLTKESCHGISTPNQH
jgi:hypothetical protein